MSLNTSEYRLKEAEIVIKHGNSQFAACAQIRKFCDCHKKFTALIIMFTYFTGLTNCKLVLHKEPYYVK